MKQITERLTFANMMSAVAVFLVLGGTAFAASQLGKNSVGTKQLKKNAVTKAKIKNGAVITGKLADGSVTEGKLGAGSVTESKLGAGSVTDTKLGAGAVNEAKIKDGSVTGGKLGDNSVSGSKIQSGAVTGDKVADGSLTGADIDASSTSFSQIVARLRNNGPINLQGAGATLVGTDNQPPNEDDVFFGGLDVTFQPTCAAPRSATVFLLLNNAVPTAESIIGIGTVSDSIGGTITKRLEIGDYGITGGGGMRRMGTSAVQNNAFFVYAAGGSCNSGSGISGSNLGVDVLGTE